MMLQGPVGGPYPGKHVMLAFVAFFAFITWRSSRSAIKARREQRNNAEQGFAVKPDPKKSVGSATVVAVIGFFLLVTALAAICAAWPK